MREAGRTRSVLVRALAAPAAGVGALTGTLVLASLLTGPSRASAAAAPVPFGAVASCPVLGGLPVTSTRALLIGLLAVEAALLIAWFLLRAFWLWAGAIAELAQVRARELDRRRSERD